MKNLYSCNEEIQKIQHEYQKQKEEKKLKNSEMFESFKRRSVAINRTSE